LLTLLAEACLLDSGLACAASGFDEQSLSVHPQCGGLLELLYWASYAVKKDGGAMCLSPRIRPSPIDFDAENLL
jgi:hypothetical protein